ncbi:MAG: ATP-binding protein [Pseudomonadota bacterium]
MPLDLRSSERTGLEQRLRQLIWARLAIASALSGATLAFRPGGGVETIFGPSSMVAMLVVTLTHLFMGIAFLLIFKFWKVGSLSRFAFIQIVWDLLFATALVSITGGIESQFWFLYWLTILNAAFLLFRAGAFSAAALSGIFYATLVDLQYFRHIPAFLNIVGDPPSWQETKVIASIVLNAIGFGVVGLVSSLIASTYRDTETRLAEKSLEVEDLEALMVRIVESLTSGLVTLDSQGKINYWNGTAEEITQLRNREVRGKKFAELFPDSKEHLEKDLRGGRGDERPWIWEMIFRRRDGSERILGFSVTGLRHGDETVRGTLIMFQDLTHYREMENRVKRADRLAVVGELAARMAHEIRNPLTSVSGAIEVLRSERSASPEDRRLMDIVVRETDRLNFLLTDFLLYARPTPPQFEDVSLDRVVQETVDLFASSLGDTRVRLKADLEPNIGLWGDSKRLCQLVWNLIKNASESMGKDGGEVSVRLQEDPKRGDITIEVRDQGPGISSEIREKVFQPFFTTKSKGSGLGLAVVHRIAEEHGGSVSVENGTGGGAIFRAVFPRRRDRISGEA